MTSSVDAQSIASCETYDGHVIIDSAASGSIELNGVRVISGDLTAANAKSLTSISADALETIQGSFALSNMDGLTSLQFPSLTAVNRIEWEGLPGLQNLDFTSRVTRANQVLVSNTSLKNSGGLELTDSVEKIDLNNNFDLTTVGFNNVTNITQSLSVSANEVNLKLYMTSLEYAANITVRNVSEVYASKLTEVGGAFAIYSSYMKTLEFSALVSTGNTLAAVDCPSLGNLSMNALTSIGGSFVLRNNTELPTIDLPRLETVAKHIQLLGAFDAVSMPSLSDIRGDTRIETTSSNASICDDFQNASSDGIIRGQLTCKTSQLNSSTDDNSTDSTTSSNNTSDSSSSSSNTRTTSDSSPKNVSSPAAAIAGIVIGGIVALVLIAVALWYFCIKRKPSSSSNVGGNRTKIELPADTDRRSELQGDRRHQMKEKPNVSMIYQPTHELHGSDVPELRVDRASKQLR